MSTDSNSALQAALAGLGRFHPTAIDLSLGRIESRLAALGNPERRLPPVFHVAGTNGKGSTVAFLRAFLEAAGYRCHVYTSPHLVRFNERIRLAGQLVKDEELLSLITEVEGAAPGEPITTFEMTTAIALLAFSRVQADATLIEVGLGGRFDATNLFTQPYATAVTRISFDHRQFFGNSLAAIAGEKAGIFRKGAPAVVADQPSDEARAVLVQESRTVGAPLFLHGEQWRVTPASSGFHYEGPGRRLDLPPPALLGQHQFMNAATALTMLDAGRLNAGGGFWVDDTAIRRGLCSVHWPGRLQHLLRGPLVEALPQGWELWLDGGHNDSGGEALAVQAQSWRDRPLDLVFGMLTSKQPHEFLQPLAPFVGRLRAVAIPGEAGSLPAEAAAAAARDVGIEDALPVSSAAEAVMTLSDRARSGRILICGSLYLAGAILADNG